MKKILLAALVAAGLVVALPYVDGASGHDANPSAGTVATERSTDPASWNAAALCGAC